MNNLDYYRHKTILITGGSGYIGSVLVKRLQTIECNLVVLTRMSGEIHTDIKANIRYYNADIRDVDLWREILPGVDIIFYFAGQTSSKFANENPLLDVEVNLTPIIRLVNTCQLFDYSPDILFAGTSTQVGFTEQVPVNEDHQDKPITVYDINKLTAEQYLLFYSNQLNKQAVSLRLTNVYGPGSPSSKQDRGILNLMVKKTLHKEVLTVFGEGNFLRDYIFIDDVINAFLVAGRDINKLKGKYYIIGSGKGYTIRQMMELIQSKVEEKTNYEVEIRQVPSPEGMSQIEYRNFVADSRQFRQSTGWQPKTMLSEGIEKSINYFKSHS